MKTFRYILSMAVLILGCAIGWVWGTNYYEKTDYFPDTPFNLIFLPAAFGVGCLLLAVFLSIPIWPGSQDKRIILRYTIAIDLFILLPPILAFIGSWGGSALGMYIEKTDYAMFEGLIGLLCGGSLGFLIAAVLAIMILPRKMIIVHPNKKQTDSTPETPYPP